MPTVQSYSINSRTTAGTLTVTKPSGVVDGDLMIAHGQTNSTTDITAPAGWTQIHETENDNSTGMQTWYRVASSEGASYDFTAPDVCIVAITRINGQTTNSPVRTSSENADNTSDTTANGAQITQAQSDSLLLMCVGASEATSSGAENLNGTGYSIPTSNPTWNEVYDQSVNPSGANSWIAMAWGERNPATATGAPSCGIGTSRKSVIHLIEIAGNVNITMPVLGVTASMPNQSADVSQTVVMPVMVALVSMPNETATQTDRPQRNLDKSSEGTWVTQNKSA